MNQHSITSARNGLKIAIPLRPYGVLERFSSKGDNELIFTDPRKASAGAEAKAAKAKTKAKKAKTKAKKAKVETPVDSEAEALA